MATRVTDAGLVHLKGLTHLKELWLTGSNVTDAGMAHLKELTATLEKLHPYDCPEVVALPVVGGSVAYLDWLIKQLD